MSGPPVYGSRRTRRRNRTYPMMNASRYMTPYQWMTSGPSLRATGFRLGYVSTRAVTRASIAGRSVDQVDGHARGRGRGPRASMETFRVRLLPPVRLSRLQPEQGPEVSDGE